MKLRDYQNEILDLEVSTDASLTQAGRPADAKAVGDIFESLGVNIIEPRNDDIPLLFFTGSLPTSKDDGKVKVKVDYVSKTTRFSEYATLKVQGNTSSNFPKKNFNITFFSDPECKVKSKHNFKGWGKQNKFTLKANWIDITHARNVVTARLWTDVVKSREDFDSLPLQLRESPNLGVIDGFYVKVYANGVYQGRYTLNMPKDPWMFNMSDELETNMALFGEDFLSSRFKQLAVVDGTDWTDEIHEDAVPQSVIDKLNALISFVMNNSDVAFKSGISAHIDVQSFIDWYIFGFVACLQDSFAKNLIMLSYDSCPFICSAYDLDTSWGLYWDGASLLATNFEEGSDTWITKSNLFIKLKAAYTDNIVSRYNELRNGPLSEANIISRFENFMSICPEELIKEDYASTTANGAFTEIPSRNLTSIQQIRNYMASRLVFADSFVNGLIN